MYHKIQGSDESDLNVLPQAFAQQMKCLKAKGYESITLEKLVQAIQGKADLPKRPIVITFDDAYQSVSVNAKPVLDQLDFTATVFVVPQAVGKYNIWDEHKSLPVVPCMSLEELQTLVSDGWEIGSHGLTHRNLTECDKDCMEQEVGGGKLALEKMFGKRIHSFCYPFGAWNAEAAQTVKAAGFLSACAISPGTASVTANNFAFRRIYVKYSDSLGDFKRKISGWYLRYRAWRKR